MTRGRENKRTERWGDGETGRRVKGKLGEGDFWSKMNRIKKMRLPRQGKTTLKCIIDTTGL